MIKSKYLSIKIQKNIKKYISQEKLISSLLIKDINNTIKKYLDFGKYEIDDNDIEQKGRFIRGENLLLKIIKYLDLKNKGKKYKLYFCNEIDSNKTHYERFASYGLMNIQARNKEEAVIMGFVLRVIVDDNYFLLAEKFNELKGESKNITLEKFINHIKEYEQNSIQFYEPRGKNKYYGQTHYVRMRTIIDKVINRHMIGIRTNEISYFLKNGENRDNKK